MTIVGVTGDIGHGKSTFAADLASFAESSQAFESSDIIMEVANQLRAKTSIQSPRTLEEVNDWLQPLPSILKTVVHQDVPFELVEVRQVDIKDDPASYAKLFDYLELIKQHPQLAATDLTPENKAQVRPLLQWLGGYLVKKVDNKIWYKEIVSRISYLPPVELVTVGGLRYLSDAESIREIGGHILAVYRPDQGTLDANDVTEQQRAQIQPDSTIVNDGSLEDLRYCASVVLTDLKAQRLQGLYSAGELNASAS